MLDASWVSPSFYSRPAHSVTESRSRRRTRLGHQLSRHHQRYVQAVVRKRVLQEKTGAQDRGVSAQRRVRKVTMLEVTARSEEHTSELQSLMRHSYAVFCLKKKNIIKHI